MPQTLLAQRNSQLKRDKGGKEGKKRGNNRRNLN
jgi:hypothetical protein